MTNIDLGIKSAVKDWMNHKYENWIKQPIEKQTLELESFIGQQVDKAQTTAQNYNPLNQYNQQPIFYRGLFWIAVGLLIILWLISG
ncbi:MAG: hypothetical protein mread185_000086 [Mycoplasmataceae bacterium]|nr:MAG: hypothetical protein mread185_000043 [Mycoplasmataceae bacterium]WNE40629.1 MAG: hypothetical protein mread185_000086 [Mycoplasmataceae bacterium]